MKVMINLLEVYKMKSKDLADRPVKVDVTLFTNKSSNESRRTNNTYYQGTKQIRFILIWFDKAI